MPTVLMDPKADAVLARLQALHRRQMRSILLHGLPRLLWYRLTGRRYDTVDAGFFRDKLVALDPDKSALIYTLCRALGARRVVEVGTSFGVSTIYLAAAVRDNVATAGGEGIVIGTELEPTKAAAARENFAQAGVAAFIELREGDALETLRDPGGPVDFVLIDTWIPLARPALERLMPHLRPGAIVACDNTRTFAREYRDYTDLVRDPAQGFRSLMLPYDGGFEISVRVR